MTDNTTAADLSSSTAAVPAGLPSSEGGGADAITSLLPPGAFRTTDHAYYFNGKGPYPSVTTILDVMSKPALIQWKAQQAAKAMLQLALENGNQMEEGWISPEDETELISRSLKEADKARDDAARIGSGVHLLADMQARSCYDDGKGRLHHSGCQLSDQECRSRASETAVDGFQVSDEVKPYLEAFRGFLGRYSASSIISSEKMVLNYEGYAGTYDFLMMMKRNPLQRQVESALVNDQELWLIDIKTSKGYYPETGLQLAAYRWADVIILEGDPKPYPMPIVHRTAVLHLRPDQYPDTGWRLIEYPTTAYDYQTFLSALKLYEWRKRGRFTKSNLQKP